MSDLKRLELEAIRQRAHELKANLAALKEAEGDDLSSEREIIKSAESSVEFVIACTEELEKRSQARPH